MSNEELFDTSSEVFDPLPDTAADTDVDPVAAEDSEQGSEEHEASSIDDSSVADTDSSSACYTVIEDNGAILAEIQRIEGYTISILYMLYIFLAIFFGVVLVKAISYFTRW